MTRAAVAILEEDFAKAWQYTPLSLTLLPVFAFYLLYIYKTGRYIRKGEEDFKLRERLSAPYRHLLCHCKKSVSFLGFYLI
ncbi:DUF2752 domain-containing protein [Lactobacillus delbrueckii]|uniref:DUF2752 domain-containing protein n=1 Tax=Lactobacillus delbrueckii TaxID=1584 RepID=UPI000E59EB73|nr:DUF2752 domain-containing protein [Lactobacillus delbrueckii]RHX66990.1 hypothetical protein DSY26_02315 [Lactobacillus delbrueckii]